MKGGSMRTGLKIMDGCFHIIHLLVIGYCMIGWVFEEMRMLNFWLLLTVAFSWFGLGKFFGFGYCLLTDLHWKIKKARGEWPLPDSYIKYILDKITGFPANPGFIDKMTSLVFLGLTVLSVTVNFI